MQSEILDRPPPHDLDAEKAVIGSILIAPARFDDVCGILHPDDFHTQAYGVIYGHCLAMRNGGGGAIDTTLLLSRLRESGDIEAVGGANGGAAANIDEAVRAVGNAALVAHFAKIVKGHAECRRVIHTATEIVRDAYNGVSPAVLRQRLTDAMDTFSGSDAVDFQPMTLAQLMERDVTVEYVIDNLIAAPADPVGRPGQVSENFPLAGPLLCLGDRRPFSRLLPRLAIRRRGDPDWRIRLANDQRHPNSPLK